MNTETVPTDDFELEPEPETPELEPERAEAPGDFDLEPNPARDPVMDAMNKAAAARMFDEIDAEPESALMQVLPADFPLSGLIKFVPNPALRTAAEEAARYALAIEVSGLEGLKRADAAVVAVRTAVRTIETHFEEPKDIANRLHKGITGTLAEWVQAGKSAINLVGGRIAAEKNRLDAIAAERRRRDQQEADRKAREDAQREADAAAKAQAPAAVVEEMRQRAEVAKAPPLPLVEQATALAGSVVVENWQVTIAGTPRDADQNPDIAELSETQRRQVLVLLGAIVEGRAPIAAITVNWSYCSKRAKSDKATFAIPGLEAYDAGGVRARAIRRKSS